MYKEGLLDRTLRFIKRFIPKRLFNTAQPTYHKLLALSGALVSGNPSKKLKVIGVTGTKGKSTTVYMASKLLEAGGHRVAAVGSLGFKIKDEEWPNELKMTMPGRWKLQNFLRRALKAGCTHVVMEVPSEGLAQGRHLGIQFDCAVFTGLHREHLETHGTYEKYRAAKEVLFEVTKNIHVINADDDEAERFGSYPATKRIFYGIKAGEMRASDVATGSHASSFSLYGHDFRMKLGGRFNVYNALAALSTAAMYGVDLPTSKPILESIDRIPGRMDWVQAEPFGVVVDYAHTPDSLRSVYETLKPDAKRLICVLGAAGGGRDTWKRPEFGQLADEFCDRIFLTDEDPYDEEPEKIVDEVALGIEPDAREEKVTVIMDRREAMKAALTEAKEGDIVVITGKGSETSIAVAGNKKIPWSDRQTVIDILEQR